jgi:hypothetical protein
MPPARTRESLDWKNAGVLKIKVKKVSYFFDCGKWRPADHVCHTLVHNLTTISPHAKRRKRKISQLKPQFTAQNPRSAQSVPGIPY